MPEVALEEKMAALPASVGTLREKDSERQVSVGGRQSLHNPGLKLEGQNLVC